MNDIEIIRKLEWYDDLFTVQCISCLGNAEVYTGHVTSNDKMISAGFCNNECYKKIKSNDGCFGEWKLEYGLKYYDLRNE